MKIDEIAKIAEIVSKLVPSIIGLLVFGLSVYAVKTKLKDVFKSERAKSQLIFVDDIRKRLGEIFFDLHYVSGFKAQLELMEWTLSEFQELCPSEWEQYKRHKDNSLHLFYIFMKPNHYLIPDWFEKEALSRHYNIMQKFAPFTIRSIGSVGTAEVLEYQNELLIFIDLIDDILRKNV